MNLQAKKLELVQMILNTEKPAIEEGLAEADRGELIPHEEVMKEVREKYNLD